jgi:hypothetical protein
MSERHLEWLMVMTSPHAAAEWRLSKDKDGAFKLRSWQGLYLARQACSDYPKASVPRVDQMNT